MTADDAQPFELMQRAAEFFDRESIRYRVVGSMASIAYGEPRFTNDIDILVDLSLNHVDALCAEFREPDFYISPEAVRDAIQHRHQFNILHLPSGLKIDVVLLQDSDFSRIDIVQGERLANEGLYDAWFASPENVILKKLEYFREGGSEKHLRDVVGICTVRGASLNRTHIDEWAAKLGVSDEWKLVCDRLNEIKQ